MQLRHNTLLNQNSVSFGILPNPSKDHRISHHRHPGTLRSRMPHFQPQPRGGSKDLDLTELCLAFFPSPSKWLWGLTASCLLRFQYSANTTIIYPITPTVLFWVADLSLRVCSSYYTGSWGAGPFQFSSLLTSGSSSFYLTHTELFILQLFHLWDTPTSTITRPEISF